MKLQKLTIHNIASIEDATIDFEAEPLSGSDVFLITGKTGSGKTTILDAICIALYGMTPRMRKSGATAVTDSDLNYYEARQIIRRGSTNAEISLNFIGINGNHYVAKWSVNKARNKVDGKLQRPNWELHNIDSDTIISKNVEKEITDAVGLDFNQFCRTTMLAQGQFTKFLYSADKEKADILEKITGVDAYSRIGAKIYEICKEKNTAYTAALDTINGVQTLSEEELLQKENTLKLIENDILKIKSETDDVRAKLTDSERALNLMGEIEASQKSLEELKNNLEQLLSEFTDIVRSEEHELKTLTALKDKESEIKAKVAAESDKKEIYAYSQTITQSISNILERKKSIGKLNDEIASLTESLNGALAKALTESDTAFKEADGQHQKKVSEIQQLEKQIEESGIAELRQQRDDIKSQIVDCENAKTSNKRYIESAQSDEKKRKELADRQNSLHKKMEERDSCVGSTDEAQKAMDSAKEKLERQKDSVDKFAVLLRRKLKNGDSCPVCGHIIDSALPDENELKELVAVLQEDYDKAVTQFNKYDNKLKTVEAEIKAESASIQNDSDALLKDDNTARKKAEAIEACRKAGLDEAISVLESIVPDVDSLQIIEEKDSLPTNLDTTFCDSQLIIIENKIINIIARKIAEQKKVLKDIEEAISEGDKLNENVKEERKVCDALLKKANDAKGELTTIQNEIAKCQKEIEVKGETIKTDEKSVMESTLKIDELVSFEQWKTDWKNSPESFTEMLTNSAAAYKQLFEKMASLGSNIQTKTVETDTLRSAINAISTLMPQWKSLAFDATDSDDKRQLDGPSENDIEGRNILKDAVDKANRLNSTLSTLLESIRHTEELIRDNSSQLNEILSQENIFEEVQPSDVIHEGVRCNEMRLENAQPGGVIYERIQCDEVRPERGESDGSDSKAEHSIENEAVADKLKKRIERLKDVLAGYEAENAKKSEEKGAISQKLTTDKANKERIGQLIEDANRKKEEFDRWSEINALLGDSEGNKFKSIAQSYVLSCLAESANTYMKTLTDRYTLSVTPGTFIISVIDAYQGYISRAASTISGGESFLVSLSLALALSDIGQGLGVNTLFIDEGFGTLSGEPLQNAISTLRALHDKTGKHVGIISHIDELRERIPVQIQVQQKSGSSVSEVIVTSF